MGISFFGNAPKPKPIQNVAIIGSGIAGLTLKHALEQEGGMEDAMNVSIFDSRKGLNYNTGAGIQLNGGMSTLRRINPTLQRKVADASLPLTQIKSRAKLSDWKWPWESLIEIFSKEKDKENFQTLLEIDLKDAVSRSNEETRDQLIVDDELMSYVILRGSLQEILVDSLYGSKPKFGKTLIGIEGGNDGIMCKFEDGSIEGPFDLVVGADGIKSAVKEYVETGEISANKRASQRSAIYSGIRIQYAVADGDENDTTEINSELHQYFGDGTYALSGIYGAGRGRPPAKGAFTIFRDEDYFGPFRRKDAPNKKINENADWVQDARSDDEMKSKMLERAKQSGVPLDEVGPIISRADRFFELGVYFHSPISSFNGWKREVNNGQYVVLCGDAAHAMPPFLGQGANQAVQDSYCLASKIHQFNTEIKVSTELSFREYLNSYEKTRWLPTTSITLKAALLGYLEVGGGFLSTFRDNFFKVMGAIGVAEKVFLDGATPGFDKAV
eukprot:CAMPEP_0116058928 /NCGR_PEP_ID=MMETSP0322-20121206/5498_1 /TAXON_ID=163516 /ORGANISM="Leptocylindrus danicus var. apora, Strain B651" /LENGTH=498 /DNA_ID=CAMNT_0003543223 /DNA_START=146 /DNA_END=1643 /DNA_ORIENTATION=+